MNRSTTRIGLGIAIYLSSLIYGSSSFAVSLKFSDRYELVNLEERPFFEEEFLATRPNLNFELNIREQLQDSSDLVPFDLPEQSSNADGFAQFILPEQPSDAADLAELNIQEQPSDADDFDHFDDSQLLISYASEEDFSNSTLNIQVQGNDGESEDINLLEYLTNAIANLQFESIRDNSFINPNVLILPQVAYQDIYRGLYDFNIDLVSPRSPRVASSSIPQNALISQESISNYNYTPASAPSFTSSYLGASNLSGFDNNTPNSYTSDRGTTTEADNYIYEDLSTRLESVLAKNTNIYTNREEIDVPSSRSFITPTERFNSQRSEKSRELAKERQEKERIRIQQRQVLQRRMEQEQAARERQRQQQAMNIRRKREMELRNQLRRQQQALQRQ